MFVITHHRLFFQIQSTGLHPIINHELKVAQCRILSPMKILRYFIQQGFADKIGSCGLITFEIQGVAAGLTICQRLVEGRIEQTRATTRFQITIYNFKYCFQNIKFPT